MTDFFDQFIANRNITVVLQLGFEINGIQAVVSQMLPNRTALDYLNCIIEIGGSMYVQDNSDHIRLLFKTLLENDL